MPTIFLDPRFWGVVIFFVMETFAGITVYNKGLDHGKAEVQARFDAYVITEQTAAIRAQAQREAESRAMQTTNQEVTANYESLKTATATAVRALDTDRMRALSALAAARHSTAPSDPATGLPTDASPEDKVLGECLKRYEEVAGNADGLSNQVKALQDYINTVVPKP